MPFAVGKIKQDGIGSVVHVQVLLHQAGIARVPDTAVRGVNPEPGTVFFFKKTLARAGVSVLPRVVRSRHPHPDWSDAETGADAMPVGGQVERFH